MIKKTFTRGIKFLALAAISLLLCAGSLLAQQSGTGQITGTVLDSNNQAVANASIKAVNNDTALEKTANTNDEGGYTFVLLPPGKYTVTANATGFAEQKIQVELYVGRTADVNFALGVQGVSAEVQVTGDSVQTTTSNFDSVQNDAAITNLPINGRRFQDFVTLTPTAQVDPSRGQISLSGQRGINSNINVDGVDYNQPFFGGIRGGERSNSAFTLPQEAIREFQVVAAGYSAEFGRSSGGIVNVVTKSGTNSVRGSAFYLLRPKELARPHAFAKALGAQKLSLLTPPLDSTLAPTLHQFGGSVGGPIIKEKLFYFASYEQQRFRAPRQVIFTGLGNVVTSPLATNQAEGYNLYNSEQLPFDQTNDAIAILGKIDWNIGDANRFSVRYNFSNNKAINGVATGETALDPTTNNSVSTNGTERDRNHIVVAQLVTSFTASVSNEARFQYAREERPRIPNAIVANINTSFGIYGTRNFLPTTQFDRRFQVADNLTIVSGNHTIKFGGEYSDIFADQTFGFNQTGVYSFAGLTGTGALEGMRSVGLTATYRGRFDNSQSRYAQQIGNLAAAFKVKELAFFGQDAWRIRPNLTVNLGLRYEKQFNPTAEVNNTAVLNAISAASFPMLAGTKTGYDPSQIPDSQDEWGPRAGFAWDPTGNGKTVLRAFSGVYYARTPLIVLAGPFNNFRNPAGDLSVTLGSLAFSATGFNQAAFDLANPQYTAIVGGNGFAPNSVFRQFAILGVNLNTSPLNNLPTLTVAQLQTITNRILANTTNPPANLGVFQNAAFTGITNNYKNPMSVQFGGGFEHEIMKGTTIGLDYSQVNTSFLQRNRDINLPSPMSPDEYIAYLQAVNTPANFASLTTATTSFSAIRATNRQIIGIVAPTSIPTNISNGGVNAIVTRLRPVQSIGALQLRDSSGKSMYRALTFRINMNRKWGRINAFYTLSKSLSDDDNERDAGGVLYDNPYDLRSEYYLSRLDRRHQFVANPVFFLPWGLEVASAIRLRSGVPFNSTVGADLNGDGLNNERPMITPSIELRRNYFYNRNLFDVDMRVQKGFKFSEKGRVVVSAEFFNVLNRANAQYSAFAVTNYCSSSTTTCGLAGITNTNFKRLLVSGGTFDGQLNFTNLNPGSQVFQMQLGARVYF
jgi:outer membrane receptor for ferrienterochelin and colicin